MIGAGDVVEHKSGPGFQRADGSELVAVMRRDAALARDFAARHQVRHWYADADALIADPEVDAVYVATPPNSHCDYVRRVARAGKPVYVEKPMARTSAECQTMIEACAQANDGRGVALFVAYYRRAMPRFETARRLITDGQLGELRSVSVRYQRPAPPTSELHQWRLDPRVSGGGYFVDLASHTFDWLDHAFGPITTISGDAAHPLPTSPAVETSAVAAFSFASGVIGAGMWDFAASEAIDRIEVVGTRATLTLSSFGVEPLALTRAGITTYLDAPYPEVVQLPLIQHIVDVLSGRTDHPISTGDTALRTARVIDAVLAGHRERQGVTFG
ncbi:MAG: Gfo/Idh/MocA family oxidoreductase [Micropruina sp.]|uniref:Gfo/Idh/MocA family protein n=1 Tax=Micropruina sp. TaxID=2737536 RepID=UPI0039E6C49E